jgi:hypothetical protein
MLVLLIGREESMLKMVQEAVKDEDFESVFWKGSDTDFTSLKQATAPDLICVGAGLPGDVVQNILTHMADHYQKLNLPEVPKYAYVRSITPDEKKAVMAAVKEGGEEELKKQEIGPFATPKFVKDSVAKFRNQIS